MQTDDNKRKPKKVWLLFALGVMIVGLFFLVGGDLDANDSSAQARRKPDRSDSRSNEQKLALLKLAMQRNSSGSFQIFQISGTIRDKSGEAVPEAEVVFAGEFSRYKSISNEAGAYNIKIPAGSYHALARAEGYVSVGVAELPRSNTAVSSKSAGLPMTELAPVIIAASNQEGVDLILQKGARITGTVFDSHGYPLADAVITGRRPGLNGARTRVISGEDIAVSKEDGTYSIDVLGGAIRLGASHREYAGLSEDSRRFIHLQPGDLEEVDLTLTQGCIISGEVINSNGEAISDGAIELWTNRPPPNDYEPNGKFENGRFRFTHTKPGQVRIRAWPWKSPPSEPMNFDCEEGAVIDDVSFVVYESSSDISGTVVSVDGEPLADTFLDIIPLSPGGMGQQERADEHGQWAFFALPAGRYHLSAYMAGEGIVSKIVTVPSDAIELELSGTDSIEGTVQGIDNGSFSFEVRSCQGDESLRPVFGHYLHSARKKIMVPVQHGYFEIDDLPVCKVTATAYTSSRNQLVSVIVGQDDPIELDLREPIVKTVQGQVRDSSGPSGKATVMVSWSEDNIENIDVSLENNDFDLF